MKKLALMALTFGVIGTATAQNTSEKYNSNEEMQEQMRLIINTLGLDNHEIYQLGQIMEAKRLEKEKTLAQIEELKITLQNIEADKEKELRGILTDDQWAKYQSEIKPKTEKVVEEHMKTIDK